MVQFLKYPGLEKQVPNSTGGRDQPRPIIPGFVIANHLQYKSWADEGKRQMFSWRTLEIVKLRAGRTPADHSEASLGVNVRVMSPTATSKDSLVFLTTCTTLRRLTPPLEFLDSSAIVSRKLA